MDNDDEKLKNEDSDNKQENVSPSKDSDDIEQDKEELNDHAEDNVMNEAKQSIKNLVQNLKEVGKKVVKFIKFIIKLPGGKWILLFIILVLVMIFLIGSFNPDVNVGEDVARSNIDTQDLINQSEFERRNELRDQMVEVRDQLKNFMTQEEYDNVMGELETIYSKSNVIGENISSNYDKTDGFQVINQDAIIMMCMERLSYAWSYLEWTPEYDNGGTMKKEIEKLTEKIEEQMDRPEDERTLSNLEIKELQKELEEKEIKYEDMQNKLKKYKDLNKVRFEIYKDKFLVGGTSMVHPAEIGGEELKYEVVEFYKDINGDELGNQNTAEFDSEYVKEVKSYFHNILTINRTWKLSMTESSLSPLESWLNTPTLKDKATLEKEDIVIEPTQKVESIYKLSYEMQHHESTLNLILNDNILNTIFDLPEVREKLIFTLKTMMPIYEYVTYSNEIKDKTFWDYEQYDENYFSGKGEYKLPDDFEDKLLDYATNEEYQISFQGVEAKAQEEFLLERYKKQYEDQMQRDEKDKDLVLIEDLEEMILKLEEQHENDVVNLETSADLKQKYVDNYKNLEEILIRMNSDDRLFDAHNHNVVTDLDNYYLTTYDGMPIDSYTEGTDVTEVQESLVDRKSSSENVTYSYSTTYVGTTTSPPGSYDQTDTSKTTIITSLKSLKPLKVRTPYYSTDYVYTLSEVRETNAEEKMQVQRDNTPFSVYKVSETVTHHHDDGSTTTSGPNDVGYDYSRTMSISIYNYGKYQVTEDPFETNVSLVPDTTDDVVDWYGFVQSSQTTVGAGFQMGNMAYNIIPGSVNIQYFNQARFAGSMYGSYTMQSTACGPTSIYMIIKSFTDISMTLPEFCQWCYEQGYQEKESGASYRTIISGAAKAFGLESKGIRRLDKAALIAALQKGNPVVEICGPGEFTDSGHFLVITGIDANGQVTLNDPGAGDKTYIESGVTYSVDTMIANGSTKCAHNDIVFWEIARPGELS